MAIEKIQLTGITWDHVRGYDPMLVTSHLFCESKKDIELEIHWHKRSLQNFADRPLEQMIEKYDLMVIDHPHVGIAAASGLLVSLNDKGFNNELCELEKQSVGSSYLSYNYDNKQWALPIDAAAPIAVFRPDLIEQAPTHLDQVIALAEKGQLIFPLKPINALMAYYSLLANIDEPFGTDGIGANKDASIDVLEIIQTICRHVPKSCFGMDPIDGYEYLCTRSTHSYMLYPYGYSNYSRTGFRPHLVKAANMPSLGIEAHAGATLGGTGIAISHCCQYQQIALEYAFELASSSCQKGMYFDYGGQPGNKSAWLDEHCNQVSHGFFSNTMDTMEKAYLRPRHNGYMVFQDMAGDIIVDCLSDITTPVQATEIINEAYDKSLKQ